MELFRPQHYEEAIERREVGARKTRISLLTLMLMGMLGGVNKGMCGKHSAEEWCSINIK